MKGLTPIVPAKINGHDVRMVVSLGASVTQLSPYLPKTLGLTVGEYNIARVATFSIGGYTTKDWRAPVGGRRDADGALGRDLLSTGDAEFDLAHGAIRMFRSQGCDEATPLYWADGVPYSVIEVTGGGPSAWLVGRAKVNGRTVRVMFDTGEERSYLDRKAAAAAGVRTEGPDVTPAGNKSWLAPVASFAIGDEQIKDTRLRIADFGTFAAVDMVIGADFFLSHRLYLANDQHRLYFTYEGGPVFRLDDAGASAAAPSPSMSAATPAAGGDELEQAEGLARRAAAYDAQHRYALALVDLDRAIGLAPGISRFWAQRAGVRVGMGGDKALALKDLDEALRRDPAHTDARMSRGKLRLEAKDLEGARTDFQAALKLDPKLYGEVALTYDKNLQFDPLLALYAEWLSAEPSGGRRAWLLSLRCWTRVYADRELDKAMDDCNAAMRVVPFYNVALAARGYLKLRRSQWDAASADFEEMFFHWGKNDAWGLYGRGLVRLRKGQTADGQADLKAAAALVPDIADQMKRFGFAPDAMGELVDKPSEPKS